MWRAFTKALAFIAFASGSLEAGGKSTPEPSVEDGTIRVPGFELPPSGLLTGEMLERQGLEQARVRRAAVVECFSAKEIAAQRSCLDAHFWIPLAAKQKARFAVRIQSETIARVPVEVITPSAGVSSENQGRVLINLHGGAFIHGGRFGGQVESIPIAAVGKMRVISIDYRKGPEHAFPAASEDVTAVYRALLKHYEPESIGIFGCSAGGVLAAQAVAWIQKEQLPRPGAVGMFCGAATFWSEGDSGRFAAAMGQGGGSIQDHPYLKNIDPNDPLAFPIRSRKVLANFPAALLISSTRDLALSSVVHTHSQLVQLGVDADLHLWEGLDHAFFNDPDLPQSLEVYDVVAKFFERQLGKRTP